MTMTTPNTATVAPPQVTAARRYSEQITSLLDRATKEYLVGLAALDAEAHGYDRPKEGEQVRTLLDEAIGARYKRDPKGYEHAVRRGRQEMSERQARRSAQRT
jgi:hypothetical protein